MATPEEDKRIAEALRERIGAESCLKPREAYSLCFNKWYSEAYLPSGGRVELGCQDLFATYQECLDVRSARIVHAAVC